MGYLVERMCRHAEGAFSFCNAVCYSPDGLASQRGVQTRPSRYDTSSNACVATLKGHSDYVRQCATLLTGLALQRGVTITPSRWDTSSNACVATLKGHSHFVMQCATLPTGLASQRGVGTTPSRYGIPLLNVCRHA